MADRMPLLVQKSLTAMISINETSRKVQGKGALNGPGDYHKPLNIATILSQARNVLIMKSLSNQSAGLSPMFSPLAQVEPRIKSLGQSNFRQHIEGLFATVHF